MAYYGHKFRTTEGLLLPCQRRILLAYGRGIIVEAERFIVLLRREPFDYTKWRQGLFEGVPLDTFLRNAQAYRDSMTE